MPVRDPIHHVLWDSTASKPAILVLAVGERVQSLVLADQAECRK